MTFEFLGLSDEQKQEVIEFNRTHLNVEYFNEDEAIKEADTAIANTYFGKNVILELSRYETKSKNPETFNLGMCDHFYLKISK